MTSNYKFLGLCVIFAVWLGESHGLECYECLEVHADLATLIETGLKEENTCKYKIPRGITTTCPVSTPFCFSSQGKVMNGKDVEVRSCGKSDKPLQVGEKRCQSLPDPKLRNFKFTIGTTPVYAESGTLCLCGTDKCNSDSTTEMENDHEHQDKDAEKQERNHLTSTSNKIKMTYLIPMYFIIAKIVFA